MNEHPLVPYVYLPFSDNPCVFSPHPRTKCSHDGFSCKTSSVLEERRKFYVLYKDDGLLSGGSVVGNFIRNEVRLQKAVETLFGSWNSIFHGPCYVFGCNDSVSSAKFRGDAKGESESTQSYIPFSHKVNKKSIRRGVFMYNTGNNDEVAERLATVSKFGLDGDFICLSFTGTQGKEINCHVSHWNGNGGGESLKAYMYFSCFCKDFQGSFRLFQFPEFVPVFHCREKVLNTLVEALLVNEEKFEDYQRYAFLPGAKELKARMKHPFIVIEGLDGTGKTTLCKALAGRTPCKILHGVPPEVTKLLEHEAISKSHLAPRAVYSLVNYVNAVKLADIGQSCPVIMDRFWQSTAAYGIASETSNGDFPEFGNQIYQWPGDLLKPDVVIFLMVPEHIRHARLNNRKDKAKTKRELLLENNSSLVQRISLIYQQFQDPSCKIVDASGTPEQVLTVVMSILGKYITIR